MRELESLKDAAGKLDAPELHRQRPNSRRRCTMIASTWIGSAKELIETTCKTIHRGSRWSRKCPSAAAASKNMSSCLAASRAVDAQGSQGGSQDSSTGDCSNSGASRTPKPIRNQDLIGAKAKPRGLVSPTPRPDLLRASAEPRLRGFFSKLTSLRGNHLQRTNAITRRTAPGRESLRCSVQWIPQSRLI